MIQSGISGISGMVGMNSGNVGQNSGNVGQNSGNVGQNSGNVGQNSGNTGPSSGNIGMNSGISGMNSGGNFGIVGNWGNTLEFSFRKNSNQIGGVIKNVPVLRRKKKKRTSDEEIGISGIMEPSPRFDGVMESSLREIITLNGSTFIGEVPPSSSFCEFSQQLLEKIIKIFNKYKAKNPFLVDELKLIKEDADFKVFEQQVCLLQKVDPSCLNQEQGIVFFTNLFHSLLLHACVACGPPPGNKSGRIAWDQRASYLIGSNLNNFSDNYYNNNNNNNNNNNVYTLNLMVLEHAIRRVSPIAARYYGLEEGRQLWKDDFSRNKDPRRNFICCKMTRHSSPMFIYTEHNLDETLDKAVSTFLRNHVELIKTDKSTEIIMPSIIKRCVREFSEEESVVLKWIAKFVDKEMKEELCNLSTKNRRPFRHIKFSEFDWSVDMNMEFIPCLTETNM